MQSTTSQLKKKKKHSQQQQQKKCAKFFGLLPKVCLLSERIIWSSMFFLQFFSFFSPLEGGGETLKKNFSYFYVMLMPVCCQIVVTLVLHQARRHAGSRGSWEILRRRQGKACRRTLSLTLPQVVLIVFIAYFFGEGKENTNNNSAKSWERVVCASRELVRLSCLFSWNRQHKWHAQTHTYTPASRTHTHTDSAKTFGQLVVLRCELSMSSSCHVFS